MSFGGLILTNRGRNLLAKTQTGLELKFTRVGLGDGSLGTGSITELQALRSEVKSLDITNLEVVESNAEVTTFLSNANMTEGFYLREIGIFALDPDIGEILYCYDNSGMDADYIPPEGEVIIERNMRFSLIVSNASSVTATINSSLVFATKQELEALEGIVDGEIGNIEDLQTESKTLTGAINELERDKADKVYVDGAIESIEVPVKSVNDKTGDVSLTAGDVGAVPTARKVNNKALSADITLTKADVGLGSVMDYGIATETEALAGASNVKYMTPLRTMQTVGVNGGMKRRIFTDSGTFKVPIGVTEIYVTACGGGGGGNSSNNPGGAGGTTSISSLVSLPGGAGGTASAGGNPGGAGGGKGGRGGGSTGIGGGGGSLGNGSIDKAGAGVGNVSGDSASGAGGAGGAGAGGGNDIKCLGAGHGGGGGGQPGAGGGGACIIGKAYSVTPNATHTITVGDGGISDRASGGKGIVIIEW